MGYQITNTGYGIEGNPCADKVSFLTEEQAKAAKTQAAWDHDAKNLKVYHCKKCDLYHLATSHDDDNED